MESWYFSAVTLKCSIYVYLGSAGCTVKKTKNMQITLSLHKHLERIQNDSLLSQLLHSDTSLVGI